ncbi:MAG: AI-2E family transporter [Actinomycetota bacterium]
MLRRWSEFRRSQRENLRASNSPARRVDEGQTGRRPAEPPHDETDETPGDEPQEEPGQTQAGLLADTLPPGTTGPAASRRHDYGTAGRPLNRTSPFYVGFIGALGVFVAYGLYRALGQLTQVMTLLIVAFFLTLTLNPLVETLCRRGMRRPLSVAVVFAGLVAVFTALGFVVVPPVAEQSGLLADRAPTYLDNLLSNQIIDDLDSQYHVLGRFQAEVEKLVTDSNFVSGVFGGVLGASKALAAGFFAILTVLVLTLYFLSSLPRIKDAAYGLVPSSRRPRIMVLSEEIMRRVGSYAIGQVAVAAINAICSYVMMTILGIQYAAVLSVVVGVLGLIPMVGASLGAAVVCLVAVFDEPQKAAIALVYYVVYQQVENYVVAPKIMQRTISVPGAITVIAALIGATLAGVLGALLAIPVAAGLLLIYEEVVLPRQSQT